MRRGGSRSHSRSEASSGKDRDGHVMRDAQPSSAPGKRLGHIRKPSGNCSHHGPKSDDGTALLLVEGLNVCPDRHRFPARRSHGQRAPSSQAPSSPRRVAACSLTAGGLNRRHGSTSPWALLDGLTSTPLFQESLTADGRGASIGVMEMYQSQRSVMAAQLCEWTKPP